MINLIFTLTLVLINANIADFLLLEERTNDSESLNSYIDSFINEKPFIPCSDEAVIVSNLINVAHKKLYETFYSTYVNETSSSVLISSNIFEAMDGKHVPSSLHYALLIAEALKIKGYNEIKFFKLFDHFGFYYEPKDGSLPFYFSILSHNKEEGFAPSAECFVDIYNFYKINANAESLTCAEPSNIYFVDDIMSYVNLEVEAYKKSLEPISTKSEEEFIIAEFSDNPEVSVYFNGLEFIDKNLRTLVNSYIKADRAIVKACSNDASENKIFLNLSIINSSDNPQIVFEDSKFENSRGCLEEAFNSKFLSLVKEPYDVKIVGVF